MLCRFLILADIYIYLEIKLSNSSKKMFTTAGTTHLFIQASLEAPWGKNHPCLTFESKKSGHIKGVEMAEVRLEVVCVL